MLTDNECKMIASAEIKRIFGKEYLQNNKDKACLAVSVPKPYERLFVVFVGLKTDDDCPHMKANKKGWTVYAEIRVNRKTGKIEYSDYQTEAA